jgi:hypothetical protein
MVTTHQDDVHILKLIDSISDNIVKQMFYYYCVTGM